tara:strand:- start:1269 stop:1946 length:678 start_codon:yes stop_codon:yes gene_type:complete
MFPFPFSFISGVVPDVPVEQIANAEAMSFNGVDAYIDLSNLDQTILNSSFTVCFWLNKKAKVAGSDNDRIIDFTVNSGTSLQIITDAATNKFGVYFKQSNTTYINQQVFNSWNTVTNSWHHISLTWDGSSYAYYFDGSPISSTGTSSIGISGAGFYIGKRADNAGTTQFKGELDEVAIFNTALSSEKITQIYDATAVVGGVPQTANLFTGGLSSSLVYWNRMGDS